MYLRHLKTFKGCLQKKILPTQDPPPPCVYKQKLIIVDNLLPDHVGLPHVLNLTVHLVGILTTLTVIMNAFTHLTCLKVN